MALLVILSTMNSIDLRGFNVLLEFVVQFLIYFIPCTIGAFVAYYLKSRKLLQKKSSKRKKASASKEPIQKKAAKIFQVFVFAITPAILITIVDSYLGEDISNHFIEVMLGIAFMLGFVSEDVTYSLSTLQKLLNIASKANKTIASFNTVLTEASKLDDEDDDDDDNGDDNPSPPKASDDKPYILKGKQPVIKKTHFK